MATAIMAEITRLDVQGFPTSQFSSITDVKQLSSYNWIEAPTPTIVVPGSPPLWSPPNVSQTLNKDSGFFYIAQNAARHPQSPMEPLFRALYISNPSFDIGSIDVVTDRNNIRKLLSFVDPSSTRDGLEAFSIRVEVTNRTAIFSRMETATHRIIGPHDFRGFGHEFEKAYTTSQIAGSTGHHRIISYRFGGLNFIVRHETDGYVAPAQQPNTADKKKENDGLSNLLASLSLGPTNGSATIIPSGSQLSIKEEGKVVPLDSTLEIKTRVFNRHLGIREVAPQLWISQTPKLVRAYHQKGKFHVPKVEDLAAEIRQWEETKKADLSKLAFLVTKITKVVKDCGGNAIVKYDNKGDKLVLTKVGGDKMLPTDLYSKWDDKAGMAS